MVNQIFSIILPNLKVMKLGNSCFKSCLNVGLTFAIFRLLKKLAINGIGLLGAIWNDFRNSLGILEGLVDLSYFHKHTENISPLFIVDEKKELVFGFLDIHSIYVLILLFFLQFVWQRKWSVYWIHLLSEKSFKLFYNQFQYMQHLLFVF